MSFRFLEVSPKSFDDKLHNNNPGRLGRLVAESGWIRWKEGELFSEGRNKILRETFLLWRPLDLVRSTEEVQFIETRSIDYFQPAIFIMMLSSSEKQKTCHWTLSTKMKIESILRLSQMYYGGFSSPGTWRFVIGRVIRDVSKGVLFFHLGNSPASKFYMATFRNTVQSS